MTVPIACASIAPIDRINTFVGFTSVTEGIGACNPSDSITTAAPADDVTDSAAMPINADDIDFFIAAAFNSPVDTDFIAKQAAGGSHNDELIFPVLDYES
jgi:hypothetical protein